MDGLSAVGEIGGVMGVTRIVGIGRRAQSVVVDKREIGLEVLLLGGVESGVRGSFEGKESKAGSGLTVSAARPGTFADVFFHLSNAE